VSIHLWMRCLVWTFPSILIVLLMACFPFPACVRVYVHIYKYIYICTYMNEFFKIDGVAGGMLVIPGVSERVRVYMYGCDAYCGHFLQISFCGWWHAFHSRCVCVCVCVCVICVCIRVWMRCSLCTSSSNLILWLIACSSFPVCVRVCVCIYIHTHMYIYAQILRI